MNTEISNPIKKCRKCGKDLLTTHGNRQFCPTPADGLGSDCKISFNNAKAKLLRDIIKKVQAAMVRNMKILESFFARGALLVTGEDLERAGFNPDKSTGRLADTDGRLTIPVFFKYKLIKISNNKFKIEKL